MKSFFSGCILEFLGAIILLHAFQLQISSVHGTDLEFQFKVQGGGEDDSATYRLDYTPPVGDPAPNTTILARDHPGKAVISGVLPGSRYEFRMYFSNSTTRDVLQYKATITTAPDPPSNLVISAIDGIQARLKFEGPKRGKWSSFNLKVFSLPENKLMRSLPLNSTAPFILGDLTPGGSYRVQVSTVFDHKESPTSAALDFTTTPNPPTNCIVWFRNETTLRFLWQPPTKMSIYSHYKVEINPKDAVDSVLFVEKGDPPGPANAVFLGLTPGRRYKLYVQSYSEGRLSSPISAEYWTNPLRPSNLRVEPSSVTSNSFTVIWDPPEETSEYDRYRVLLDLQQPPATSPPVLRNKTEPRSVTFSENLKPGRTYKVSAMTISGQVNSAEAVVYVTLKPLPVKDVKAKLINPTGHVNVTWTPSSLSGQDSFEVSYTEVHNGSVLNGDSNTLSTNKTMYLLESLLPGRNYSISVRAVSNKTMSNPVKTSQATRPTAPVIEELKPVEYGLNISWKSDVNSRQDKYEIRHKRNDTKTNTYLKNITRATHILINNLYPGAGYNIRVYAISHNLMSEPHDYFQAVYPKPPTNLKKANVTSNSLTLSWEKPKDSLFSEFSVRFRTEESQKWLKSLVNAPLATIAPLTPGEHYLIKINSVSYNVESARPLSINHTVNPSPVTNIAPLIDSNNMTVEFPRPVGRIEYYVINWLTTEATEQGSTEKKSMNVSADGIKSGQVKILIDDLMPGVMYQFDIHTVSYGLHCDPTLFAARTMPLINSDLVVVCLPQETSVMTIRYSSTNPRTSRFDKYRFKLSDNDQILEKSASDELREVTYTDLIPGKLYNITVWTVSSTVLSQPMYQQGRLYPDPVPKLTATHIADTVINLVWEKPKGEFSSYEIQYMNAEGVLVKNLTRNESCTIGDLKPYKNYTFTVTVRSGSDDSNHMRKSLPVTATFQTQEGLPGKVTDFHSINIQPREIIFTWSLAESEWNGILKNYTVIYGLEGSTDVQRIDFPPEATKGTISDLIPGKTYIFRIQAQTVVGYGPDTVWKEVTPIQAPPKPGSQFVPTEICRTSSTIQVRFRKSYFSEENGPIVNYTIIVAEDYKKNTSVIEMLSWFDVQGYGVWPPYQVTEPYYPFKNSTVEDYTIGSQDCSNVHKGYCNGPLKGGTIYRVKVRAFTSQNKFTDTDYSFPIQTETETWPIILGVSLGVILVSSIIVIALVIRKFSISFHCGKKQPKKKISVNLSLSDCIMETSKPIKLDKFSAYFEIMTADSDFRISEEFDQLKQVGTDQSTTQASLPCNRSKNRFTNILPYDHSRFKLQPVDDEEGSDYINANYVPGYHSPREFIVTQGPLPATKDDFWRMCWESNARAIVMLTKCIEKGREKCDHYWPEDTRRVFYGDISVTISNESYYPHWTITELLIQRGETQRVVKHFHFTTWPDFGVPNPPTILVRFVRTFREKITTEPRPIVVHCSAGVGRSGTFIAIDRILQSLRHGADVVDIFGVVYQMRKERILMVQTEQQYICIHKCILSVLQNPENPSLRDENHQNQAFEDDEGIALSST